MFCECYGRVEVYFWILKTIKLSIYYILTTKYVARTNRSYLAFSDSYKDFTNFYPLPLQHPIPYHKYTALTQTRSPPWPPPVVMRYIRECAELRTRSMWSWNFFTVRDSIKIAMYFLVNFRLLSL